jgi:hypothetical protein
MANSWQEQREQRRQNMMAAIAEGDYLLSDPSGESLDAALGELELMKWQDENIDYTPQGEAEKRTRLVRIGRERFVEDDPTPFDPASPQGQREAERQMGVANEGLGFSTRLKLAMSLDDEEVRKSIILKAAEDIGLPQEGELPPGQQAVFPSPVTGDMLLLLKDKETGKFRQHRVDALGPEWADLADMADPSEVGSIIGGVYGSIQGFRQGRPFMGEAAGEAAGRALGTLAEVIASRYFGDKEAVDSAVVKNALLQQLGEGGLSVLLSRGFDNAISVGRQIVQASVGGRVRSSTMELSAQDMAKALDETAGDIEKLRAGGGDVKLTIGEATGDATRLAEEAGRVNLALTDLKRQNARRISENTAGLSRYVDRQLGGANVFDPARATDTYKAAVKESNDMIDAGVEASGRVRKTDDFFVYPDGERIPVLHYDVPGIVKEGEGVKVHVLPQEDGTTMRMVRMAQLDKAQRGVGGAIYRQILDDAQEAGHVFASDSKISLKALRVWNSLEKEGNKFSIGGEDRTIQELVDLDTGKLTAEGERLLVSNKKGDAFELRDDPTAPILKWESGPVDTRQQFLTDTSRRMDQKSLEDGLAEVQSNFHRTQSQYESSVIEHDNLLGWNPDRQVSRYYVNNSPGSKLQGDMRRLRMISQRALGRGDAREADRLLADLFRGTGEEDDLMASFADPQLDVRQLIFTMDRLREIGAKGSPEAARVAGSIDSLLRNGKWRATDNMNMDTSAVKAQWQDAYGAMRRNEVAANRAGSSLMTNRFLQEGYDGSYSNTTVSALEKVLKNGNGGVDSMRQAVDENIFLKQEFRNGLYEVWKRNALPRGTFSHAGHERFMRQYSDAIDFAWGPRLRAEMDRAPHRMGQYVSKSAQRLEDLRKPIAKAAGIEAKELKLNPRLLNYTSIWKSLRRMSPENRRKVTATIRAHGGEEAVTQMNEVAKREVANSARSFIEKGDPGKFKDWIDMQEVVLADQFGPRYVEDLRLVQRMVERTHAGVKGISPDAQPLWLRVGRSLFGPLSKKQRFATAVNFTKHRILANNALEIIADPDRMRQFKQLQARNGKWTTGSVAFATRLGLFDGVPLSEDVEQRLAEVQELFFDLETQLPVEQGKPEERAVVHPRGPNTNATPSIPKSERPTVMPGRGTIAERRQGAIRAFESDLPDLEKLGD